MGNVAVPSIIPKDMDAVTMQKLRVTIIRSDAKQAITLPVPSKASALENSGAARWPRKVILFYLIHTLTRNQL